ncbi:hypothetical protein BS17DRAFT_791736, partial [Gyrodon lividus]
NRTFFWVHLLYYLDIVSNFGYIPMVTQSDPEMENFGIENSQTMLCQISDAFHFHWLFIPWLQNCVNNTQKHWDRNKMLPPRIPEQIHTCSKDYSALNFKVMVSHEAIEHVLQLYIKPDPDHIHTEIAPNLMVINANTGSVDNGQGCQEEHIDALEALECDEPQSNINEVIDAGPSLWMDCSDAKSEEEADNVDEMI